MRGKDTYTTVCATPWRMTGSISSTGLGVVGCLCHLPYCPLPLSTKSCGGSISLSLSLSLLRARALLRYYTLSRSLSLSFIFFLSLFFSLPYQ